MFKHGSAMSVEIIVHCNGICTMQAYKFLKVRPAIPVQKIYEYIGALLK
jgi:hypothetical protein